jgi:hypothetical protein
VSEKSLVVQPKAAPNEAVRGTAARLRICLNRMAAVGRRPETAGVRPSWQRILDILSILLNQGDRARAVVSVVGDSESEAENHTEQSPGPGIESFRAEVAPTTEAPHGRAERRQPVRPQRAELQAVGLSRNGTRDGG